MSITLRIMLIPTLGRGGRGRATQAQGARARNGRRSAGVLMIIMIIIIIIMMIIIVIMLILTLIIIIMIMSCPSPRGSSRERTAMIPMHPLRLSLATAAALLLSPPANLTPRFSLALKRGTTKGDPIAKSPQSHLQVTFKWLKGEPFARSPFAVPLFRASEFSYLQALGASLQYPAPSNDPRATAAPGSRDLVLRSRLTCGKAELDFVYGFPCSSKRSNNDQQMCPHTQPSVADMHRNRIQEIRTPRAFDEIWLWGAFETGFQVPSRPVFLSRGDILSPSRHRNGRPARGRVPWKGRRIRLAAPWHDRRLGKAQRPKTYPHPRIPAARLFFVILLCVSVFSSTWGNPEVGGGDNFLGS